MRILLVSQEMPPDTGWGGIGSFVARAARALADQGAEVTVLSVVAGQTPSEITDHGVTVIRRSLSRLRGVGRLTGMRRTWDRFTVARGVEREVRALGGPFDVIECPEWMAEGLRLAGLGMPLVIRLHSSAAQIYPREGRKGFDVRRAIRLEERAIRQADLVVGTASQLEENHALIGERPTAEQVLPVPERAVASPPTGPPTVVVLGRMEGRKSPDTLIDALPQVRRTIPGARLVVAGRDSAAPDRPSYAAWLAERAEAAGVADAVDIRDRWLEPHEVDATIDEAHVVAVPSTWESFGYVAAEAAMAGRPVVASATSGLVDVVDHGTTGLLVPMGNPPAWAEALIQLLTDRRAAAAMGEAAARQARERFGPASWATRALADYERAASLHRHTVGAGR